MLQGISISMLFVYPNILVIPRSNMTWVCDYGFPICLLNFTYVSNGLEGRWSTHICGYIYFYISGMFKVTKSHVWQGPPEVFPPSNPRGSLRSGSDKTLSNGNTASGNRRDNAAVSAMGTLEKSSQNSQMFLTNEKKASLIANDTDPM